MPSTPSDPEIGVFDTMLARDGRIQALGAHLDRLAASVSELYAAALPPGLADDLRERAAAVSGEGRLRVDAAPGPRGLQLKITTSGLAADRRREVLLRPFTIPVGLGHHKWIDRRVLESAGAEEDATVLIVDSTDEVLEAAWANVWLIEDDRLITPPDDGRVLPGTSRALLLRAAPSLGFATREESIPLGRARAADGIFLTSSLRHAVPATLGPEPSAVSADVARIAAALAELDWE